ncbi:MAG: CHAT domain-containing tetratricopeptide repeat protein [Acidobacteriota bacterium]
MRARHRRPSSIALAVGAIALWLTACGTPPEAPAEPKDTVTAESRGANRTTVPELAADTSLEVELAGGEIHSYRIALAADTFVRVGVEQLGIDIVVSLFGPDDDLLIKFDKLTSTYEAEQVLWVTDLAGVYRLEVAALETAAAGRYVLRLDPPRPSTDADRQSVAAEIHYAAGEALRGRGNVEARDQAAQALLRAVALWSQLDNPTRSADGYFSLGITYGFRRMEQATAAFESALALLERAPNPFLQAAILHWLGHIRFHAGDLSAAVELFKQALIWRGHAHDARGAARTHNNLGRTYELLGELPEALDHYREALARWREDDDAVREAVTLHNLGKIYLSMGLAGEALDHLQLALEIRRGIGDTRGQASTLSAIGQTHDRLGASVQALAAHQRALDLSREFDHSKSEAVALGDIALLNHALGRSAEALDLLQQALVIFRQLNDRNNEANTLHSIGWMQAALDRPEQAALAYRQALPLFEAAQNRHGKIMTLRSMALAERRLGNFEPARRHIETAIDGIEQIRTKPRSHALRYSYFATKQSYYETYIDLLMDLHRQQPGAGFDAEALAASERARARSQLDGLTESGADLDHGTAPELAERERRLEQEIESLELRRLQLLDEGGQEARRELAERQLRELFIEYDQVQEDIRRASPRYAALTQPHPLSAAEIQRQVVDSETLLLEYDLGVERSYLWAVTSEAIHSFELPPEAAIEQAARQAYKLLSSSHLTGSRAQTRLTLERLSRLLLQPVAPLLDDQRLLIVADGALQYLPFFALPAPGQAAESESSSDPSLYDATPALGELHEIVNMASASTLAMLRSQLRRRPPATDAIAVFADPVFGSEDPRLRQEEDEAIAASGLRGAPKPAARHYERLIFSRQEAEDILTLAPVEQRFAAIGFDARREAMMSGRLGDYRILHFATHGELNAEHPELSRLVLSLVDATGEKLNGHVFAHEIYGLELSADLVVLSACETALGVEVRGEGLLGLTQGFMYAGAASVIVSLWNVDDQATAELMARFYRRLLQERQRPAAALRAAQASIRQETRWQAPYYWAGFVLQGEWR